LINSPKFFTPNGDGFNETWNIIGLPVQNKSVIYIFDRYGKLLKELDPNGPGWDGTYNGYPLPSDDYWFSIAYTENNVAREYRSHFSLKR
jgi:gliding motility-associated-like protein